MEENFNPVAQTRANYYTPGSPVQFVCVELLKGDVSGEHAVCLTFKNISRVTLTALEIHFKCKGVDGVILCEDKFEYRDLQVKPGELFGQDDAVFITAKAITSVDVSLCNVYNGKRVVHLDGIKRVRLPAPRRLAPELQKALEQFVAMRETEGERLKADVLSRLLTMEEHLSFVEERSPQTVAEYRARLTAKLTELLNGAVPDENRILTEVGIIADRLAVDEETVRLRSHFAQLRKILESTEPVGRKLDFLVQEMNRETNTIGSKCSDTAIAGHVVEMKSELEKIREQIQNIE